MRDGKKRCTFNEYFMYIHNAGFLCLLFVRIYAHEVALNAFNIQYVMLNIQTLTANE